MSFAERTIISVALEASAAWNLWGQSFIGEGTRRGGKKFSESRDATKGMNEFKAHNLLYLSEGKSQAK